MAGPLTVLASFAVNSNFNLCGTQITATFRPPVATCFVIDAGCRLLDYPIAVPLQPPYQFLTSEAMMLTVTRCQTSALRSHYLALSDGREFVVFSEPLKLTAQLPMRLCGPGIGQKRKRKRFFREHPPLVICGFARHAPQQSISTLSHFALEFGPHKQCFPFEYSELSKLRCGQVLQPPFPLRLALDARFKELLPQSHCGMNVLSDGNGITIPYFPPASWDNPAFESFKAVRSVPAQVYERFRDFLIGRRCHGIHSDWLFENSDEREQRSASDGLCYDGREFEIVGRSLVFWENDPEHGRYYVRDSILHGHAIRIYAFREHALQSAARRSIHNPMWHKPYCLYRTPHDEDGFWKDRVARFMRNRFADCKRELEQHLASIAGGEAEVV